MRLSFPLVRRHRQALALASVLTWAALLGAACQPSPSSPAPVEAPSPVLNAPALPLDYPLVLQPYIADLLDNVAIKKWERHIVAVEPGEGKFDLFPEPSPTRARKTDDVIELHFRTGEELFEAELTLLAGYGDAMGGKAPNMHRVHRGAHGGPDATTCKSCHHRGGDDGAGEYTEAALTAGDGEHATSASERNPPALHGGGVLQILAREITENLQKQISSEHSPTPTKLTVSYQGVEFGTVQVYPDGRLDTSALIAIDGDLIVRPFGWKGTHSTLRRFAEEAFQVHHGMQSTALVGRRRLFGPLPVETSPATRGLLGALGEGGLDDPDFDLARNELLGSQLTAMAVYLTLLPLPTIEPPRSQDMQIAWREGVSTFEELGCTSCHKSSWYINEPTWSERGEDESSHVQLTLDLRKDLRNGPQLHGYDVMGSGYPVFIFSDLRRHDMGRELADPEPTAKGPPQHPGDRTGPSIPPSYFLTRPLWGLSDSGPYLHDGRAITLHAAIVGHGGEAAPVRDAYLRLPQSRQRALQIFLYSLTRQFLPEVTP